MARLGRHRPRPALASHSARLATPAARTAAVLATALALSLPLAAVPSPAAAAPQSAAVAGEFVSPAAPRAVPRATQILNAGTSGFLWAQEGDDRLLWTDYATGAATALEQRLEVPVQYDIDSGYFQSAASFKTGYYGRGSDTVALYSEEDAQVTLVNGGGTTVVPVPEYHTYQGTFGDTVLTSDNGTGAYQLWRVQDGGGVTGTSVTGLPDGAGNFQVEDGDARSVILKYSTGASDEGWGRWGIVDLATGAFSALPDRDGTTDGYDTTGFRLGADSVLRLRTGRSKADLYDRDDLSAAPRTFETSALSYQAAYGIIGDTLLGVEPVSPGDNKYRGQPLFALTSDGTDTDMTKVMDPTAHGIVQAPDGSVLVAGAAQYVEQGDLDWGVYRVARAADGSVTRSRVTDVQPMPAQVHGLSLGNGVLTTADNSTLYEPNTILGAYRSTWLTTSGTPAVVKTTVDGLVSGRDGDCYSGATHCIRMFADGTGHHGRRRHRVRPDHAAHQRRHRLGPDPRHGRRQPSPQGPLRAVCGRRRRLVRRPVRRRVRRGFGGQGPAEARPGRRGRLGRHPVERRGHGRQGHGHPAAVRHRCGVLHHPQRLHSVHPPGRGPLGVLGL